MNTLSLTGYGDESPRNTNTTHGASWLYFTDPGCWCRTCDAAVNLIPSRMCVCPECGDKRCDRAEYHEYVCSKTPNSSLPEL